MAWNSASVMRPRRRRPSSCSIWAGIGPGVRTARTRADRADVALALQFSGDGLLDPGRSGQVREHLLTFTAGRFQQHVAGADQPLQETLVVADVGQGCQGDLPTVADEDSAAADEAAVGHDQAGGGPADVTPDEPGRGQRQGPEHDPVDPGRRGQDRRRDRRGDDYAEDDHGAGEVPPVGPNVDRHLLALVEQPGRNRHQDHGRRRSHRFGGGLRIAHGLTPGCANGHTPGLDRCPVAAPAGWFGGIIRQARNRHLVHPSIRGAARRVGRTPRRAPPVPQAAGPGRQGRQPPAGRRPGPQPPPGPQAATADSHRRVAGPVPSRHRDHSPPATARRPRPPRPGRRTPPRAPPVPPAAHLGRRGRNSSTLICSHPSAREAWTETAPTGPVGVHGSRIRARSTAKCGHF